MKNFKALINTTAMIAIATASGYAQAREHIEIVGSSTVYPFSTVVAETFGNKTEFPTLRKSNPPVPAAA